MIAHKEKVKFAGTGMSRTLTAIGAVMGLALEISVVGMISMDSNSTWLAVPVAALLAFATIWMPKQGQKMFWLVFTIWIGMTFAHSGELLEIAIFGLMILLAVLGYRVSTNDWVVAWTLHALWHFFPREHLSHDAALLMGHWMSPLAGALFGLSVAAYLYWISGKVKKALAA